MEIAKALILAGRGCDDRPWPAVPAGTRHLFPVANRPILFHNLEALRRGGLLEATVLVDNDNGAAIEQAVGNGSVWGLAVRYAEYDPAVGLGGALTLCRSFIGDEPVLVQRGDAFLRERWHAHISAFTREGLDAMGLELKAPGRWGAAPAPGYLLGPRALAILLGSPEAAANPLHGVRVRGGRVRVQPVDGCLPCHGDQDALLDCNRRVLEDLPPHFDAEALRDCQVQGGVVIHRSAVAERCTLRGPLIIGPGARLTDAYVGPYTSIGADVVLDGAEIENSIVLPGAVLRFVGTRIESSVIGRGARIVRGFHVPSALRISLGDGGQVILP